jgi:ATP-binding cassette subfamily B protein
MTERFNVSGAMLVALYGEPEREREYFRSRARRVADIGIKMAMLNRLFFIALTSVAAIANSFSHTELVVTLRLRVASPSAHCWQSPRC